MLSKESRFRTANDIETLFIDELAKANTPGQEMQSISRKHQEDKLVSQFNSGLGIEKKTSEEKPVDSVPQNSLTQRLSRVLN
jgi:hypothetical protein